MAGDEKLKAELLKKLEDTECPAFWKLENLENKKVAMKEKLAIKNEEIAGQLWRHIVLELAMSYECYREGLASIATQKLLDCHTWLKNSDEGDFTMKYQSSFIHLILSFKAFLAVESGAYSEAKRCLGQIVYRSKMNDVELAAVYGIKSNVFGEYGVGGNSAALIWVREALKLNDSEPEWHFRLGKLLTTQRNFLLIRDISLEEISSYERAHAELNKPHTAVYLAACYLDKSKSIFFHQPLVEGKRVISFELDNELKNQNRKSMQLFWDAHKGNKAKCLHIMARVAFGLVHLPVECRHSKAAMGIAFSVLEKSPSNVMAHTVLAKVYFQNDNKMTAICHAAASAKSGSYGAHIRLLNLYCLTKKIVNFEALINELLEAFPLDIYRLQTYVFATTIFLFYKRDLFKSLPYFENAMALDPKYNILKERFVRPVKVYINYYEVVYSEVSCALDKERYVNEAEKQNLLVVREKILGAWPPIVDYKVRNNLIDKLFNDRKPSVRGRTTTRANPRKGAGKKNAHKKQHKTKPTKREGKSSEQKDSSNKLTEGHNFYFGAKIQFNSFSKRNSNNKRARSDSRQSANYKVMSKELSAKLKNLSCSPDDVVLRPENSLAPCAVKSLNRSLSQLSIDSTFSPQRKTFAPKYHNKRSVSSDHQNSTLKKTVVDLQQRTSQSFFMPDFGSSRSIPEKGALTKENLKKHLKNFEVSKESLDSDDTLGTRMSNLSLHRDLSTERTLKSVESLSAFSRSASLHTPSRGPPSRDSSFQPPENYFYLQHNDKRPPSRFGDSQSPMRRFEPRQQRDGYFSNYQTDRLNDKMRDLSLEKKRDLHLRPPHGSSFPDKKKQPSSDWRSPLGRPKASERVLKPPRRSSSTTSESSVDSDYVGSRWNPRNYTRN